MLMQRIAAGLVFVAGLVITRVSVVFESWPALALGLSAAAVGIGWLAFAGPGRTTRAPLAAPVTR